MTPTAFPEANKTLTPPQGMANCAPLHTFDDGVHVLSMWKLDDAEKARVAETGVITLWVYTSSGTQPPVAITAGPVQFVQGDAAEERA